jgi:hypothetical protein
MSSFLDLESMPHKALIIGDRFNERKEMKSMKFDGKTDRGDAESRVLSQRGNVEKMHLPQQL